jgi:hypothetical protein
MHYNTLKSYYASFTDLFCINGSKMEPIKLAVCVVAVAALLIGTCGCMSPANKQIASPTATTNAVTKTTTAKTSTTATVTVNPTITPTPTPSATPIPTKVSFVVGHAEHVIRQDGNKFGALQILVNNNPIPTNGLVLDIFVDGTYVGQATPAPPSNPTVLSYSFSAAGLSLGSHTEVFVFPGNAQYAPSSVQGTFTVIAKPTPTPSVTPTPSRNP